MARTRSSRSRLIGADRKYTSGSCVHKGLTMSESRTGSLPLVRYTPRRLKKYTPSRPTVTASGEARPIALTTSRTWNVGVPSAPVPSPHSTKNFVSLKMNVSSRHVTAARICSPSPGVRSKKLRPRTGGPAAPSVSHTSGWPGLDAYTRLGVVAVPPGPALACAPNAVAISRFDAFVPDVLPGAAAVTQTVPARGIGRFGTPSTVARIEPSAHAAPSKRRTGSAPFEAYTFSAPGLPKR